MTDRTELRPAEREALYAPDRRLNAYYFGFESTGSPAIDAILSAVAYAGKGYHNTESWGDESRWGEGRSYVDVIQAAANEAANRVDAADAALARVRELHYAADNDPTRTPICEGCHGKAGVHECGCWAERDREPVCGHCMDGWHGASVPWPCPTIRALDGEARP